ncbi:MAG: hypothetical protein AAB853_05850, partial [Patescibacteria group bacterium]
MALNDIERSWAEGFSNPEEHKDDQFRYLIHGVMNPAIRATQNVGFLQIARSEIERGNDVHLKIIDLLQQPQRIADKPIISSSLIDQEHRETWAPVGFILKAPPQNIIDASPEDMGTNFVNPASVRERARHAVRTKVDDLLMQTSPYQYNEVVVEGKTEAGKVEIVGVYEKVFEDGEPVDEAMSKEIRRVARQHGYPVTQIIEKGHQYPDHPPKIDPLHGREGTHLTIRRNGVGYRF